MTYNVSSEMLKLC